LGNSFFTQRCRKDTLDQQGLAYRVEGEPANRYILIFRKKEEKKGP
jgi:hypothetical protein